MQFSVRLNPRWAHPMRAARLCCCKSVRDGKSFREEGEREEESGEG